jgi:plasmid stabilization system protein ParE
MAYRSQVSSQAWRDFRDIIAFIEKENPAAADRMATKLLSRAELLASFPYLGRKIRGRQNDRVLIEGSIQIMYRIERETVRVVRFWHSARNPDSLESD